MRREERWPDLGSPEAEKIKAIQMMTGSQYLEKDRSQGTPDENKLVCAVAIKFQNARLNVVAAARQSAVSFVRIFAALCRAAATTSPTAWPQGNSALQARGRWPRCGFPRPVSRRYESYSMAAGRSIC